MATRPEKRDDPGLYCWLLLPFIVLLIPLSTTIPTGALSVSPFFYWFSYSWLSSRRFDGQRSTFAGA